MKRLIPVLTLVAALGGCGGGILSPAGPVGRAEKIILLDSLAIMLAIVIPTLLAAAIFVWWFRASNTRARYRPDWSYSGQLELIVWSIPTLVILFLGGVIWTSSRQLDPAKALVSAQRPLEVQVVSLDWKWLFIYPDQGIAAVDQLVIPAGRPVHFSLTSASVMNVFWVPQLGSMIYTMNHTVTQLHLQADQSGEFLGQSAMFSGDGFPAMHFTVRSLPPEQFNQWLSAARGEGRTLDRATYAALSRPSPSSGSPSTFGDVEHGLFHAIVSQEIPPAPGPNNAPPATLADRHRD